MKLTRIIAGADEKQPFQVVLKDYYLDTGPKNDQTALVEEELNRYLKKHPEHYPYLKVIVNSDYLFYELYKRLSEESFHVLVGLKWSQRYILNALKKDIIKNWEHYLSEEKRIDYEVKNNVRPNWEPYDTPENLEKADRLLKVMGLR